MPHAYPLMLDVSTRAIVIIGGGPVAARKAAGLLAAGATNVTCVAPAFCGEIPQAIRRVCEAYHPGHLRGAALVFAATDQPGTNQAIVRDAHARGLLVSRADADEADPGDFITPAVLVRDPVRICVSAGSPALSAMVRDKLAQSFDPRWQKMAAAMQDLRPWIVRSVPDVALRRAIFRQLADEQAFDLLATRGADGLRQWVAERYPIALNWGL